MYGLALYKIGSSKFADLRECKYVTSICDSRSEHALVYPYRYTGWHRHTEEGYLQADGYSMSTGCDAR